VHRMAGPIVCSEEKIPWAARATEPGSSSPALSPIRRRMSLDSLLAQAISEKTSETPAMGNQPPLLFPSEHKFVDESPTSLRESGVMPSTNLGSPTLSWQGRAPASAPAPAVLEPPHRNLDLGRSPVKYGLDSRNLPDANVPSIAEVETRAAFVPLHSQVLQGGSEGGVSSRKAEKQRRSDARDVKKLAASDAGADASTKSVRETYPLEDNWGQPFKVQWLCTERLPFHRTRHLRNPWNSDREVKVSRDGIELEPTVGQRLLDEWKTLSNTQDAGSAEAASTGKLSYSAGSLRRGSGRSGWKSPRTGSTK
jgi:YT521-B-like domain